MKPARLVRPYRDRIRGAYRISEQFLPWVASPCRLRSWWKGHEDFDFPGTRYLLDQAPFRAEVLHLHNLHGDYFDLRELPRLALAAPAVVTLHDAWLLSGHCAHSFDCERWKTGCGSCPDLGIWPPLRRDGAAFNWQRKREIYRQSRLSLVCPSRWLADKVRQSILLPAVSALRVIPNGVDTSLFRPGDKAAARNRLGWAQDAFIVVFAASYARRSQWRDCRALREAIHLAAQGAPAEPICCFAIGDTAPPEQAGAARIAFLPYRDSMSECYQAADVYLHPARADTFPTTVLEALACGTPVVATAVGGIPEQIVDGVTGFLSPAGDSDSLARHLLRLLREPEVRRRMGQAAATQVAERFPLAAMVDEYISLYEEIARAGGNPKPGPAGAR
jgi:glycosyltransferase involved in cell wall biosynthesis